MSGETRSPERGRGLDTIRAVIKLLGCRDGFGHHCDDCGQGLHNPLVFAQMAEQQLVEEQARAGEAVASSPVPEAASAPPRPEAQEERYTTALEVPQDWTKCPVCAGSPEHDPKQCAREQAAASPALRALEEAARKVVNESSTSPYEGPSYYVPMRYVDALEVALDVLRGA